MIKSELNKWKFPKKRKRKKKERKENGNGPGSRSNYESRIKEGCLELGHCGGREPVERNCEGRTQA